MTGTLHSSGENIGISRKVITELSNLIMTVIVAYDMLVLIYHRCRHFQEFFSYNAFSYLFVEEMEYLSTTTCWQTLSRKVVSSID